MSDTLLREADGLIELHVDDGHGCGKETIVAELLAFLSEKIEMKYVQGIWSGSYEYLKTLTVRDYKKLTSIPNKKYLQSALRSVIARRCVSPKLDKAFIEGDSEELDERQTSSSFIPLNFVTQFAEFGLCSPLGLVCGNLCPHTHQMTTTPTSFDHTCSTQLAGFCLATPTECLSDTFDLLILSTHSSPSRNDSTTPCTHQWRPLLQEVLPSVLDQSIPFFSAFANPSPFERSSAPIYWRKFQRNSGENHSKTTTHGREETEEPRGGAQNPKITIQGQFLRDFHGRGRRDEIQRKMA